MDVPRWMKLKELDREIIFKAWSRDNISQKNLAKRFGVSTAMIAGIIKAKKREHGIGREPPCSGPDFSSE